LSSDAVAKKTRLTQKQTSSQTGRSQRELLFDLDTARRAIFAREGKSPELDLVSKTLANLMRMWADD
jgi:PKHD-type hydroxylase